MLQQYYDNAQKLLTKQDHNDDLQTNLGQVAADLVGDRRKVRPEPKRAQDAGGGHAAQHIVQTIEGRVHGVEIRTGDVVSGE